MASVDRQNAEMRDTGRDERWSRRKAVEDVEIDARVIWIERNPHRESEGARARHRRGLLQDRG